MVDCDWVVYSSVIFASVTMAMSGFMLCNACCNSPNFNNNPNVFTSVNVKTLPCLHMLPARNILWSKVYFYGCRARTQPRFLPNISKLLSQQRFGQLTKFSGFML